MQICPKSNINHTDFEGLYAATLTAWNRQGEPALEKIEPYARKLIKDNVQGIFVCGTRLRERERER